jgi:hypothetical protein
MNAKQEAKKKLLASIRVHSRLTAGEVTNGQKMEGFFNCFNRAGLI